MPAPLQRAARLGDLDVAVPISAGLASRARRTYHRKLLLELELLSGEQPPARFALEAIESLVSSVRDLSTLLTRNLDAQVEAGRDAERLCAILQRDAAGEFSPALALATVIRGRL